MTLRTTIYIAAVVVRQERILLVRQSPGHPLEGQWTVPWGRLEAGESPLKAALRETWEEGGVHADVEAFLGIQELSEPNLGGVALVYLCRHVFGEPAPQDTETDAARYFSSQELDALDEPIEPWTEWLAAKMFARQLTAIPPAPSSPLRSEGAFL